MTRPLIAVPMDYLEPAHEPDASWYSNYPWYGVKHRYHDALVGAGAISCFIGYEHNLIADYVARFDGLVITGGHFDHDPQMYNAVDIHETTKLRSKRSQFEKALLESFLPTKKPILGICGGHQLLNIIYGGTLHQDLPSHPASEIAHTRTNPPTEVAHTVSIKPATKLYSWYGQSTAEVNSSHHQGIDRLGANLVANAISDDGLIEGLEDPNHPFCLGVQWHPEFLLDPIDHIIFEKFINSCV